MLGSSVGSRGRDRVIAAGAVTVVAVIVLGVALYALRVTGPEPTPSAPPTLVGSSPSATATSTASPTAAASPSPSGVGQDRFGYVMMSLPSGTEAAQRIVVRRERDGAPVFELTGVWPAVSVDGRRLAYWRTTPSVGATDLRVLDVADPRSDRSVFKVNDRNLGGSVVWSNDGQGLLVATYSRETVGGAGVESGGPARYELLMLDLASSPPGARPAAVPVTGGRVYVPVAWDRPGQIAAAVVTGPGGYAVEYVTWNGSAASPFARAEVPPSVFAFSVQASADAKLVMGLADDLTVLRVWPILDIAKTDQVRSGSRISLFPLWRPGATGPYEVIWGIGQRVEMFRYQTSSVMTLYTGAGGLGLAAIRPDGSAVLVTEGSPTSATPPPAPPTYRLVVIDIATRQATEVVSITGSVRMLSRGVLLR